MQLEETTPVVAHRSPGGPKDSPARLYSPKTVPQAAIRYLGDYAVLGQIAEGGMGVVYRARQVSLNKKVALKLIPARHLASPSAIARFRNEANAMAQLDHPNIVPIYEIGEHQGQHYFSMKLVDGTDLAQEIAGQPLPPGRAVDILVPVARAVHHAHQRGVLHRDLKPANILLETGDDRSLRKPQVTDFGIAKLLEPDQDTARTQTGAVFGTFEYMAPEQAAGKSKQLTTATDVYGLGAILYAMLTGRAPFQRADDESDFELGQRVVQSEPERPRALNRAIDRNLETVCLKCLEKDPARRYPSALAVAEDLERWQRGEPILARPIGPLTRFGMWARRRPAIAGLAAALLVVLVAAALGLAALWRHAEIERDRAASARSHAEHLVEWLVADVHQQLETGVRLTDAGDVPGARKTLETARQLIEALSTKAPNHPRWLLLQATRCRYLGNLLMTQKDWDGALAAYRESLALGESLMLQDGANSQFRDALTRCLGQMVTPLENKGEYGEALQVRRRLQAIVPSKPNPPGALASTLRTADLGFQNAHHSQTRTSETRH